MATFDEFFYPKVLAYLAQQGGLEDQFQLLDNMSKQMGFGSEFGRYSDYFYGLNRTPNLAPLPMHREMQGLVLFTRPNLNLSYDNIATTRELSHFFTQDPTTMQYAIRMMLDPTTNKAAKQSALVNPKFPYISLLSNSIYTMNQPPDIGLNIYSSPEGAAKEVFIMNDGIAAYNGRYDLTCTFNSIKGNPVLAMIHAWIMYIGFLRVGPLIPHPEQRARGEIDYNTRIERIKFDETGDQVVQWFHTGVAIPTNISIGAGFGYNRDEALETENKQISVQFACAGAIYNDPIQLLEFNMRIEAWNNDMRDNTRKQKFQKVPRKFLTATNYNGYPHIDLGTNNMEWYVENDTYDKLVKGL